jgi:N6-adenosine-specific RNA methylase IME4
VSIELYNADFGGSGYRLPKLARLVVMDPPWKYDFDWGNGAAAHHYDGLPMGTIRHAMQRAYGLATEDAYLACWCTFPILMEWAAESLQMREGWQYVSGGAWGKLGNIGPGYHFRGNAELVLLYKKGKPRPCATVANLWLDRRGTHSEKPQNALRALIEMATDPGDLVLDPYAGASASLMRACRALGRQYVGCEIDPARHAEALRRFALDEQAVMEFA